MSIEEIKTYINHPNSEDFLKIADEKILEIQQNMDRLKTDKTTVGKKKRRSFIKQQRTGKRNLCYTM